MFAQIAARQPLGLAGVALGQVEAIFRQRIKRMGAGLGLVQRLDLSPGVLNSVIVPGGKADFERSVCGARDAVKCDVGNAVRNYRESPGFAIDRKLAVLGDLQNMGFAAGFGRIGCGGFGGGFPGFARLNNLLGRNDSGWPVPSS